VNRFLTSRRRSRGAILVGVAVAVSSLQAVPVGAVDVSAEAQEANEVVEVVETLPEVLDGTPLRETDEGFVAGQGADAVTLPEDAGGAVSVSSETASIAIGIPGAGSAEAVLSDTNKAVYSDVAEDTDLIAQATTHGGAQILIVVDSPDAPTTFRFPMSIPDGAWLNENLDGSVSVYASATLDDGSAVVIDVGSMAPPWATDANGNSVATRYEVSGTVITQVVEHGPGSAYPIVADPCWKCIRAAVGTAVLGGIVVGAACAVTAGVACGVLAGTVIGMTVGSYKVAQTGKVRSFTKSTACGAVMGFRGKSMWVGGTLCLF
jgi:hypothetical protein